VLGARLDIVGPLPNPIRAEKSPVLDKSKKSSIYKKSARFSFFIWYQAPCPCTPKQSPLAQAVFVRGA
jgi:hypothetical protein